MARQRKERAYLEFYRTGWFMGEYTYSWIARDYWGNYVASARTRKECEQECRYRGYVPER